MINFEQNTISILGQMSGTSCDGNDFVLFEIDLDSIDYKYRIKKSGSFSFSNKLQTQLHKFIENPKTSFDVHQELNLEYTLETLSKMKEFLGSEQCDIIGFHGQTVFHKPPSKGKIGYSTQLGLLPVISKGTTIPVVGDFRNHDMAHFGQGAPLVPYFDFHLFNNPLLKQMIINIGGISNGTFLGKDCQLNQISAGDIGPGNILIDLAMKKLFEKNYDENGDIASIGRINYNLLEEWMKKDKFQSKAFPKSTGREYYNGHFLNKLLKDCEKTDLNKNDTIAMISQFTIECLLASAEKLDVSQIQLSGGGAKNKFLINQLKIESQIDIKVMNLELIDFKEAIVFGLLAFNYIKSIPSTFSNTTGIKKEVVLGTLSMP